MIINVSIDKNSQAFLQAHGHRRIVAVGQRKQQLLSIMKINLHHCKAAADDLLTSFAKAEFDVALVQEPYNYNNKVVGLGSAWDD